MTTVSSKQSLLIVDDEKDLCDFTKTYFERRGFAVYTALTGPDALAIVQQSRPDLILLDIKMRGWDGLETLRRIREVDPKVRVIMLTRVDDEWDRNEAKRLGAMDYITKPISLKDEEAMIRAILSRPTQPGA